MYSLFITDITLFTLSMRSSQCFLYEINLLTVVVEYKRKASLEERGDGDKGWQIVMVIYCRIWWRVVGGRDCRRSSFNVASSNSGWSLVVICGQGDCKVKRSLSGVFTRQRCEWQIWSTMLRKMKVEAELNMQIFVDGTWRWRRQYVDSWYGFAACSRWFGWCITTSASGCARLSVFEVKVVVIVDLMCRMRFRWCQRW